MANGDTSKTVEMLEEEIKRLIAGEEISPELKAVLGVQLRFIPFLTQQQEDHEFVEDARPIIQFGKWVGAAMAALNLGYLWALLTHSGPFAPK